jgi:hypothetical protein
METHAAPEFLRSGAVHITNGPVVHSGKQLINTPSKQLLSRHLQISGCIKLLVDHCVEEYEVASRCDTEFLLRRWQIQECCTPHALGCTVFNRSIALHRQRYHCLNNATKLLILLYRSYFPGSALLSSRIMACTYR